MPSRAWSCAPQIKMVCVDCGCFRMYRQSTAKKWLDTGRDYRCQRCTSRVKRAAYLEKKKAVPANRTLRVPTSGEKNEEGTHSD